MIRGALLLSLFGATSGPPAIPVPEDLPKEVFFRGPTESFNQRWELALRDGRIWVKPRKESADSSANGWRLLGSSGLPEGRGLVRFGPPERVVAISADGCHLMALSSDGELARGTDLRRDVHKGFRWTDRWGWPAARGPGLKIEEPSASWSVSDSHPFEVKNYQDIKGFEHSVGLGVAHVYLLDPEGHIRFNDWWLPADWSRRICGPERDSLSLVNLSASASTLFVVGSGGELYTRLYDLDTSGENDLLTYSYRLTAPSGSTRALPAEPWRRQPDVPGGRITSRVTIFQDGIGNTARVLRVEGEREGVWGFFEKRIDAAEWSFVETHVRSGAPLLVEGSKGSDQRVDPAIKVMEGVIHRVGHEARLGVELLDFNLFCSPARVRLVWDEEPVTLGGLPLELTLHHVHTMVKERRHEHYEEKGQAAEIRAALILPRELGAIDQPGARAAALAVFGEREVVNLRGQARLDALALAEISRSEPFQVPRSEKGSSDSLVKMELRVR